MKRLLIISDEMEVGGSQRQIVQLLSNLDADRYQAELLFFRESSVLVEQLREKGITCHQIAKNGALDVSFFVALVRFIRAGNFNVIHCFSFTAELWGALAFLLSPTRYFVSSIRGRYEWYKPWQWLCKSFVNGVSSRVVSNSQAGLDYALQKSWGLQKKQALVYNGISLLSVDKQQLAASCKALPGVDVAFGLFVGRLVDHKNLPCLIRALSLYKAKSDGTQWRFLVAGDGPLRSQLESQIELNGLSGNVFLLGERDDVTALMSACSFVVLPSWREGLSNTILEAFANKRLIIASKAGGNTELIEHDVNGQLFTSDDEQALANIMLKAHDNPSWASAMAAHGYGRVQASFSATAMASNMMAVYDMDNRG